MRFSQLDGRTVAIWGIGRETRSFARHLAERLPGARTVAVVLDDRTQAWAAAELGCTRVVAADRAATELAGCDVLVRSPGVSIHRPELRALIDRGVRVATPTGLWLAEHGPARVIGVTGTKGKSTTATILHHLSAQLRPTHLAGNIGRPALDLLDVPAADWVVLELSSYQIADLACGPAIGVITNLFPEHVNWHGSVDVYRRDKLALFSTPGLTTGVYAPGDPDIDAALRTVPRTFSFGTPDGWHVSDDARSVQRGDQAPVPLDGFVLRGRHNAQNLCAALTALEAAGLESPDLPSSLAGVRALPHRLQTVHRDAGIEWVDDSISTTPESSIAALGAFPPGTVVLLAGGQDRQQDYRQLAHALVARGEVLITLPPTGARLAEEARRAGIDSGKLIEAGDLPAAVAAARDAATAGSTVLLSPAAPSYHAWTNFEARGEDFAALARDANGVRPG